MCQPYKDPTTELIKLQAPYIFPPDQLIPLWQAMCAKLLGITAMLIWNYSDTFIITLAFTLSTHFKLFNAELALIRNEVNLEFEFHVKPMSSIDK